MSDARKPFFPMRAARELMIPLDVYPSIHENATLADAISTFKHARIDRKGTLSLPRILLVFNDDEKLTGIVRRRDIIRGLLPDFLTRQEEPHAESHYDAGDYSHMDLTELFKDKEHKVLSANSQAMVTTIMRPIDVVVDADDDLMDLIKQIAQTQSHILPVMEKGHIIGVVRTIELLNQIRRLLEL